MITEKISQDLNVPISQVEAAIQLIDNGDTVPFIARYRKEVTGGLDDTQLRFLDERLIYLRELQARKETVLKAIIEQGKLTPLLKQQIETADSKIRLEDLYKPYIVKRRTKAQIAREAGLQPLADKLFENPDLSPETEATQFLNPDKEIKEIKDALDGAKQILMEQYAEDAELLAQLREYIWDNGYMISTVAKGKEQEGVKFSDYFDYFEKISEIPSHRALALFRGRNEDILSLVIDTQKPQPESAAANPSAISDCEAIMAKYFNVRDKGRAADKWLMETVRWCWKIKLKSSLDMDAKKRLREEAEQAAIDVFATNLKDLLMAAPAGHKATIGLDPGLRTGVKVTVVDNIGKLVDTATIYPHAPKNQWNESLITLATLVKKHQVSLIAIGNGTASRETDKLAADLIKHLNISGLTKVMVSEAGASVYSASELAAHEFPELDVSLRGAVSIARRLQDPLAELVKIDPKAIGVGQYQHDVSQVRLAKMLDIVIEDCVNAVGVDLNTASIPLLTRVAGLSPSLANNIVEFREQNGAFNNRQELKKVKRLGDKAFEQSAGFLRVSNGDNPLDVSSVHPEAYPVVEHIITHTNRDIRQLIGDKDFLDKLQPADYTNEIFGEPTVKDILQELQKPGRDPRPEFKTATFKDGVEKLSDLQEDMILEGTVTNVTNFGAFVDIGVHQDGLVHISQLSDTFVKDPHAVVKTGDIVKVKVVEIDIARKRIGLTMKLNQKISKSSKTENRQRKKERTPLKQKTATKAPLNSAMADAFSRLK